MFKKIQDFSIQDEATLSSELESIISTLIIPNLQGVNPDAKAQLDSLYSEFIEFYESRQEYPLEQMNLYLAQLPALLSIIEYREKIVEVLHAKDAIPPLKILLTANPNPSIIAALTTCITKQDGVYNMIKSFSIGEGREKMREFAIMVIGTFPKTMERATYAKSVTRQAFDLLIEKCDIYFYDILKSIMRRLIDADTNLVSTLVVQELNSILAQESISGRLTTGLLEMLESLIDIPAIRYIAETQFCLLYAIHAYTRKNAALFNVAKTLIDKLLLASEISAWLVLEQVGISESTVEWFMDESGDVGVRIVPEYESSDDYDTILDVLENAKAIQVEILLTLLKQQTHLYIVANLAEKIDPQNFIDQMPNMERFMREIVVVDNPDILEVSLRVIAAMLVVGCSKQFCLDITPRILELQNIVEWSELATSINYLISNNLVPHTNTSPSEAESIIRELNSEKAFERAMGLHYLEKGIASGLRDNYEATLDLLKQYIRDEDLFVFEHTLRCYKALSKRVRVEAFSSLQNFYKQTSDYETKIRIMEVLHQIVLSSGSLYDPIEIFPFLETEGNCAVLSTVVKMLGSAIFPWAGNIRYTILQSLKLANSRLYTKQGETEDLAGVLLLLYDLIRKTKVEKLSEIAEQLELLENYELLDSTRIHHANAKLAVNELIAGKLQSSSTPDVPYKIL